MTDIMLAKTPSSWRIYRLGQLFTERKTKVSDKDFPPLSVTMRGILPQLETAAKSDDSDNRKLVKSGDFVINSRSDRKGSGGVSDLDGSVSLISIVLKPKGIQPRFAHHLLRSPAFQEEFYRWGQGIHADLWTTRYAAMKNIQIAIPDLETQTAIADFLDRETARIDHLIEKKERLTELLKVKERSAVSALAFGGVDQNATKKSSGLPWRGPYPAHWKESRLKALFRTTKKQGYPDETVLSVYREFGVIEKSSRDDNHNKTPEDISAYQLVEPGDLVINKMKAWQGSLGISEMRGVTSPDYVVMKATHNEHSLYLHHLLRAHPMPNVYQLNSNGIRIDQWRLEPDRFLCLPVYLPPLSEQRLIAQKIDQTVQTTRHLSSKVELTIERLKEYRSALITAAVTGQIDIASYGKSGATDRTLDRMENEMSA